MIFFGTSELSIKVLEKFVEHGFIPDAIVTVPDRPAGRKMVMTSPLLKSWSLTHVPHVPIFQFEKLDDNAAATLKEFSLKAVSARAMKSDENKSVDEIHSLDIYIIASYGKIIPEKVLQIPTYGALNIHPSLLPKLRGATPLQTSIIEDMAHTGVTIIQMDKEMDHGPIVAMHEEIISPWPIPYVELETRLAYKGAEILLAALPSYIEGTRKLIEQNHNEATYTKKVKKEDGLVGSFENIDELQAVLSGENGWKWYLKYNAFKEWPGLFFFLKSVQSTQGSMRVKITEADFDKQSNAMQILRVVPEGKKEMSWKEFFNYIA